MKTKKLITLLASSSMMLAGLASCGGNPSPTPTPADPTWQELLADYLEGLEFTQEFEGLDDLIESASEFDGEFELVFPSADERAAAPSEGEEEVVDPIGCKVTFTVPEAAEGEEPLDIEELESAYKKYAINYLAWDEIDDSNEDYGNMFYSFSTDFESDGSILYVCADVYYADSDFDVPESGELILGFALDHGYAADLIQESAEEGLLELTGLDEVPWFAEGHSLKDMGDYFYLDAEYANLPLDATDALAEALDGESAYESEEYYDDLGNPFYANDHAYYVLEDGELLPVTVDDAKEEFDKAIGELGFAEDEYDSESGAYYYVDEDGVVEFEVYFEGKMYEEEDDDNSYARRGEEPSVDPVDPDPVEPAPAQYDYIYVQYFGYSVNDAVAYALKSIEISGVDLDGSAVAASLTAFDGEAYDVDRNYTESVGGPIFFGPAVNESESLWAICAGGEDVYGQFGLSFMIMENLVDFPETEINSYTSGAGFVTTVPVVDVRGYAEIEKDAASGEITKISFSFYDCVYEAKAGDNSFENQFLAALMAQNTEAGENPVWLIDDSLYEVNGYRASSTEVANHKYIELQWYTYHGMFVVIVSVKDVESEWNDAAINEILQTQGYPSEFVIPSLASWGPIWDIEVKEYQNKDGSITPYVSSFTRKADAGVFAKVADLIADFELDPDWSVTDYTKQAQAQGLPYDYYISIKNNGVEIQIVGVISYKMLEIDVYIDPYINYQAWDSALLSAMLSAQGYPSELSIPSVAGLWQIEEGTYTYPKTGVIIPMIEFTAKSADQATVDAVNAWVNNYFKAEGSEWDVSDYSAYASASSGYEVFFYVIKWNGIEIDIQMSVKGGAVSIAIYADPYTAPAA